MNVKQLAINTILARHLAWRVCIDGIDIAVDVPVRVSIHHRALTIRGEFGTLFSSRTIKATELHTDVPLSDGRDSICFLVVTPTGQRIHVSVEPEEAWEYVYGNTYKGNVMDEFGDNKYVYRTLHGTKQL